jgi:hypothetical protein
MAARWCPYWGTEPRCGCEICEREIAAATHVSQINPENAAAYAATRSRPEALGLKLCDECGREMYRCIC